MDTTKHENILEMIKSEGMKLPEKYYLAGVVLSDSAYIYRARDLTTSDDEDWFLVMIDLVYNNALNYRSEAMSFEAVQAFVLEETKLNNKQLILFYSAEHSFEGPSNCLRN